MATFKYVFAGTTYVFTGGAPSATFEFTGLPHIPKFDLAIGDYEVMDSRSVKDHRITTLRRQRQSPLLRLPGELRNQIYVYAIGDRKDIWVGQSGSKLFFSKQQGWSTTWIEQVTLQVTCRQIFRETADMHFVLNTFCGYFRPLLAFLSHPNTPKDKITSICLSFHHSNSLWEIIWFARRELEVFRARVKALPNLREASILFGFYDEEDKQELPWPLAATDLKDLLGFDSDGVVFGIRYRHWDEHPPMDFVNCQSTATRMSYATERSLHLAVCASNREIQRQLSAERKTRRLMDGLRSTFDQLQL